MLELMIKCVRDSTTSCRMGEIGKNNPQLSVSYVKCWLEIQNEMKKEKRVSWCFIAGVRTLAICERCRLNIIEQRS